jgi:hypothetical protein
MAVTTNLIKNDRQRAVLHLYTNTPGDSATVTLLSLRGADEIAYSTTSELAVSVSTAYSNAPAISDSSIVVRRGGSSGTVILDLHGFTEYPGNQQLPAIALNSTSSIFVLFQTGGMMVLDLRKVAGYAGPNTNVGV